MPAPLALGVIVPVLISRVNPGEDEYVPPVYAPVPDKVTGCRLALLIQKAAAEYVIFAVGLSVITTDVVDEVLHPFASVTVKVYVPVAAVVTFVIEGFCDVDVNEFGPLQLYE